MSRLWIFSDLHQDWADNAWDPAAHAPSGGFDIAVIAGDVHSPLPKALDWLADRLLGVPTIYVPGNHDFWWDGGDDRYMIDDVIARGRDSAVRHGIHLLLDDAPTPRRWAVCGFSAAHCGRIFVRVRGRWAMP
jgi:3',5'-cyclic AMP phosphodiesterase CpdA